MALIPVQQFGQFTSQEVTFLAGIADHSYTDGQLLIGNSSTGGVSISTLTQGTGITITNGHGTVTIASSGGGGLNPQTPSGTINSSNTSFTCVGLVTVAFVDGSLDSGAVISGATNSTITYSVPPQNSVYAF